MSDLGEAFSRALDLIVAADPALLEIVALSLKVSLSAVFLAALLGLGWLRLVLPKRHAHA